MTGRWKPHAETVSTISLSADCRQVISASTDRSMAIWDLAGRRSVFVRTNLSEPVIALTALANAGVTAPLVTIGDVSIVAAFIDGRLPFVRIVDVVAEVVTSHSTVELPTLDEVLDTEKRARAQVWEIVARTTT